MARVSELIRDSYLETQFRGDCTVHTFHESDPNAGWRLVPRNEFWHQEKYIGYGGFSRVYLQKCKGGGPQDGAVRAVKHILIDTRAKIDYKRELEAIAKFSHPRVSLSNKSLVSICDVLTSVVPNTLRQVIRMVRRSQSALYCHGISRDW